MIKQIWLNLPVKNLEKSKKFFTALGFSVSTQQESTDFSVCMVVGEKNFIVMLFEENVFSSLCQNEVTLHGCEMLISIDAESRTEVDEMAKKAVAAGAYLFAKPAESQGFMYGCAFADLDGHRWNVLYMDFNKM